MDSSAGIPDRTAQLVASRLTRLGATRSSSATAADASLARRPRGQAPLERGEDLLVGGGRGGRGGLHHDHVLARRRVRRQVHQQPPPGCPATSPRAAWSAPGTAHTRRSRPAARRAGRRPCRGQAVRRLVEHDRPGAVRRARPGAPLAVDPLRGRNPSKQNRPARSSSPLSDRGDGAGERPGDHLDGHTGLGGRRRPATPRDPTARASRRRSRRPRPHRHGHALDQARGHVGLGVVVQAHQLRGSDTQVRQQPAGAARVLTGQQSAAPSASTARGHMSPRLPIGVPTSTMRPAPDSRPRPSADLEHVAGTQRPLPEGAGSGLEHRPAGAATRPGDPPPAAWS